MIGLTDCAFALQVLFVYSSFAIDHGKKMRTDVWYVNEPVCAYVRLCIGTLYRCLKALDADSCVHRDILQMTLLETAFTLLKRSNPNGDGLANAVADEVCVLETHTYRHIHASCSINYALVTCTSLRCEHKRAYAYGGF